MTQEEIRRFSGTLPPAETPLWRHWEEFESFARGLGRSDSTVDGARTALKFVIRHSAFRTFESWEGDGAAANALMGMKTAAGWAPASYNTYRKNLSCYFRFLVGL